jgi:ribose transport system substrate-binding protein
MISKTSLIAVSAVAWALGIGVPLGGAAAADKTLAIVVKGLDNPFFDLIRQGCEKANGELKGYKCYYTGPASTADEAGEVQIVDDLLTKGVDAIAISPSNAPAIANLLRQRKPTIPVMTIDADILAADAGLRRTYLGTDNYTLGFKLGEYLQKAQSQGGKICLVLGNTAADNINQRAQGSRDALSGRKGLARLEGENGWTEVKGCPLFTNDDAAKGNQMMADVLTANADLTGFVLEGGWPQFAPQAYAQLTDQYMDRIKAGKLTLVVADTLPPQIAALKDGRSYAQVGQRPFEMGYRAPLIMRDMVEGKPVEPVYHTGLDECVKETADTCLKK